MAREFITTNKNKTITFNIPQSQSTDTVTVEIRRVSDSYTWDFTDLVFENASNTGTPTFKISASWTTSFTPPTNDSYIIKISDTTIGTILYLEYQSVDREPVWVAVNKSYTFTVQIPQSASTDTVNVTIYRQSDGYLWDFATSAFTATGTTGSMTFVNDITWRQSFTPSTETVYIVTIEDTTIGSTTILILDASGREVIGVTDLRIGLQFHEVYKDIARKCQDTSDSFITTVKEQINDILKEISSQVLLPDLLKEGSNAQSITAVASTETYALNSNFQHIRFGGVYYLSSGATVFLNGRTRSTFMNSRDNDATGISSNYYIGDRNSAGKKLLHLDPIPSTTFVIDYATVYVEYYEFIPEMVADSDVIPIPYHWLYVLKSGALARSLAIQGDTKSTFWEQKFITDILRMQRAFGIPFDFEDIDIQTLPSSDYFSHPNRYIGKDN